MFQRYLVIGLVVVAMSEAMFLIWLHYKNAWAYAEIAKLTTELQVQKNNAHIQVNNQILETEKDKRTELDKELKGVINENASLTTISNTLKSLR